MSSPLAFAQPALAKNLSSVDALLAKEDIRNKLTLYTLLADGDGIREKNTAQLAETMMTPDIVTEIYHADGSPPQHMIGRASVAGKPRDPAAPRSDPGPTVGRHYITGTYFEELTATTAKTISTAVHFDVTRNLVGKDCKKAGEGACGGLVRKATMWVYHMNWVKTPDGWQISYNGLRTDN